MANLHPYAYEQENLPQIQLHHVHAKSAAAATTYRADVWEAEARVIVIASTKMCDGVASTEVFLMRFEDEERLFKKGKGSGVRT